MGIIIGDRKLIYINAICEPKPPRLDRNQNAYLAAHTVDKTNILLIVQYGNAGDKCGVIRDLISSDDSDRYFEFECTDPREPSAVVVGTWPKRNNAVRGPAGDAWRIDLRSLKFVPLQRKATCVRRSLDGTDDGEDLAIWALRRGKANKTAR